MGQALGVAMSDPTLESLTVTGSVTVGGDLTVGDDLTVVDLIVTGTARIGNAVSDTIAFFGSTLTAQPAATNQAAPASTAPVSVSATQWAFGTSTQGAAVVNCLIEVRAALVSLGLIKGSN